MSEQPTFCTASHGTFDNCDRGRCFANGCANFQPDYLTLDIVTRKDKLIRDLQAQNEILRAALPDRIDAAAERLAVDLECPVAQAHPIFTGILEQWEWFYNLDPDNKSGD